MDQGNGRKSEIINMTYPDFAIFNNLKIQGAGATGHLHIGVPVPDYWTLPPLPSSPLAPFPSQHTANMHIE